MAVLAFDVGGTNTRSALFTEPGVPILSHSIANDRLGTPFTAAAFLAHIEEQLARAGHAGHTVDAVGIAVAAVVDAATGFVHVGENVGWRDVPLGEQLAARAGLRVAVETDAFCGALAEAQLGAGADWASFLYVTIGTGIGHGLILERRIWHGIRGAASVFGHLTVVPHGITCYCGSRGCLCQYASGDGLARLGRARRPELKGLTARDVVAAATEQPWARAIVDEALDHMAVALSHAYNLLDIAGVVLDGGAVSELYPDIAALAPRLEALVYPTMRPVAIRRSQLHGSSVLQGAALLALAR